MFKEFTLINFDPNLSYGVLSRDNPENNILPENLETYEEEVLHETQADLQQIRDEYEITAGVTFWVAVFNSFTEKSA